MQCLEIMNSLLLQGFISLTQTTHGTTGEGGGLSFILLFHFQPLSNIQKIICNYACEMTITYFYWHRLYLPDCNSMRFITISDYHLTMLDFDCLLNDLILAFCYSNLRRETGGLELLPTITLVLQVNRLTKCAIMLDARKILRTRT